jgi:hypothetical protein
VCDLRGPAILDIEGVSGLIPLPPTIVNWPLLAFFDRLSKCPESLQSRENFEFDATYPIHEIFEAIANSAVNARRLVSNSANDRLRSWRWTRNPRLSADAMIARA